MQGILPKNPKEQNKQTKPIKKKKSKGARRYILYEASCYEMI